MEYIIVGKLVNTHALKGEVRIISDFEFKNKVFVKGKKLYIGEEKEELTIDNYRHHKNFEMVTFNTISDIKDVLKYKGKKVYINKNDLDLKDSEVLDSDLIGVNVYFNDKLIGVVESIDNYGSKLLKINGKLIPYNSNFIESISKEKIVLKNVEELI